MDNKYTVGIITASDKGSKGEREDISGRRIREILPAENYEVVSCKVLPDEQEELEQEMIHLADECKCNLILTTGGTGFSMRDVTPEATLAFCDRHAVGADCLRNSRCIPVTNRKRCLRCHIPHGKSRPACR